MFKNISWTFGSNLIVSLLKWLVVVIIAKILTPEDVGAYSLAFAISAPITLFANMKLRSLFITEDSKDQFNDFLRARDLLSILSFFVLVLISVIFYQEYFYLIVVVSLMKIFDLQSDMYYALPHRESEMTYIGKLIILKNLVLFIPFLISILLMKSLLLSLAVQLIAQIVFFYMIEKKRISKDYNIIYCKPIISNVRNIIYLGIPLGVVQMLFSLNASYPRFLLEYYESLKVLGYFSAIAYILTIGNMMLSAISQTFLPILSNKIKKKDYLSFRRILYLHLGLTSIGLGVSFFVLLYYFGSPLLGAIYGREYAAYIDILLLLSVALAINMLSWNFDTALLAMRYISVQPKLSIIVLIINLILGYLLISTYGIHGATYTIIITNSVQLILRMIFVEIKYSYLIKQIK